MTETHAVPLGVGTPVFLSHLTQGLHPWALHLSFRKAGLKSADVSSHRGLPANQEKGIATELARVS